MDAKRTFDIDPFRGFVCLCLVALHFVTGALHEPLRELHPFAFDRLVWDFRLGVESFFVLAGFMVAHSLRPVPGEVVRYRHYFLRRCVRLWVPYAVAVLLAAGNLWAARVVGLGKAAPLPFEIYTQLTLTQEFFDIDEAAQGFWSLISLEQFYFAWLVILFVITRVTKSPSVVGAVACTLGLASMLLLEFQTESLKDQVRLALPFWLCYLVLGLLLYDAVCLDRNRVFLFIVVVSLVLVGIRIHGDTRPFKALFAAFVLKLLGEGYRFPNWAIVRGLAFVGQRSYSVYLTHTIVGYRVFSVYPKVAQYGYWSVAGLLVLALALSFVAALLFYKFVEVPCLNLARRIRYRVPQAGATEPTS